MGHIRVQMGLQAFASEGGQDVNGRDAEAFGPLNTTKAQPRPSMHIAPALSAPNLTPNATEPADDGARACIRASAIDGKVEQIQTGNANECPWNAPNEGRLHHSIRWVAALITAGLCGLLIAHTVKGTQKCGA